MNETMLFVDDDESLLSGLQRMLRSKRDQWDMTFVSSGALALKAMEKLCFDVVVADMRMPGMDGSELLSRVKKVCPKSVRIVLSGQAELSSILKVLGSTHQYLSKPCDPEMLKTTIERASKLRSLMKNSELEEFVSQLHSLPAQPDLFDIVYAEVNSQNPSIDKLGLAIGSDMSMGAKILQLVNSSFFGPKREVVNVREGVAILGLNLLRQLIIDHQIFVRSDTGKVGELSLSVLNRCSVSVGNFAQRIALFEGLSRPMSEMCSSTGLFRDIGRLVLSLYDPERYRRVLELSTDPLASIEMERELFGTSHSEVGGYLLGLWGLPNTIVNAASFHHEIGAVKEPEFSILAAIQLAEQLADSTDFAGYQQLENFNDLSTYAALRSSLRK